MLTGVVNADAPREWRVIHRSAYNSDGTLWAPDIIPQVWLDDQRATLGPYLFASQYLNEAIAPEERRFMPEWIQRRPIYLESSEGHLHVYQGNKLVPVNVFTTVDPAISKDKNADYTSIATVAVDPMNIWYLLSVRRFRGSAPTILEEMAKEVKQFHSGVIGIETVAFQKALKDFWTDYTIANKIRVQTVELKTGTGRGKKARIEGLVPVFSSGRCIINQTIDPVFDEELLMWSPAKETGHDDMIDALSHHLAIAYPANMSGQVAFGSDWHDLNPKEREKIKRKKEGLERGAGQIRTGYDHDSKYKIERENKNRERATNPHGFPTLEEFIKEKRDNSNGTRT